MVKLTEVEDEHFTEKPEVSKEDALLMTDDDDDDYTDTDSEISVDSNDDYASNETIFDRFYALKDMVSPRTRARITNSASTLQSYAKNTWSVTSKTAWVVSTTMILWGVPYGLAFLQELEIMEQEREQGMLRESGNMMLQPVEGEAKPAL